MSITNTYDIKNGLKIISTAGTQRYNNILNSFSNVNSDIYTSVLNNKYCMDSCWESENIYYANYNDGIVRKIKYDSTEIAEISLTNPLMVSVIQNDTTMNSVVNYPPQDDQGCWIADVGTGSIIKTDKDLNILYQLNGITDPICIKANIDGGCWVINDNANPSLIKISPVAQIVDSLLFSAFSPAITDFIDMAIGSNGWIYLCANDRIYSIVYQDDMFVQQFVITPDLYFDASSSSSSDPEERHIGAIDIDLNDSDEYVYVTGGNSRDAFILKYDTGSLVATGRYYDASFPYIIKVIQGIGSDSLYILEDNSKWEYGSSSSSSSDTSVVYLPNIKIHRILKDDLSEQGFMDVAKAGLSNTKSMTISHFAFSPKQTEATIPYEIEITEEHVPYISDIDFMVNIRTKVDLTANGVNGETIEDIGDDIGEYKYKDKVPSRPLDLPNGFIEFYKG